MLRAACGFFCPRRRTWETDVEAIKPFELFMAKFDEYQVQATPQMELQLYNQAITRMINLLNKFDEQTVKENHDFLSQLPKTLKKPISALNDPGNDQALVLFFALINKLGNEAFQEYLLSDDSSVSIGDEWLSQASAIYPETNVDSTSGQCSLASESYLSQIPGAISS